MGSELSKRYDVDKDATGSGGHGYQWKSYQATRKKDGLEVSVFVFEKAALEKQLRNQKSLFEKVVMTARRDVATLANLAGIERRQLEKVRAAAAGPTSLRDAMASAALGVGTAVATASRKAPPGCLQLIETLESRQAIVFVGERVACSLGNALHKTWPGVASDKVPSHWRDGAFTTAEVARGAASLADALQALKGAGGLVQRAHLGVSPESIWLTKTGDWRLGGFGLALSIPAGQYGVASPYFANEGAIGGELTGEPKLEYTSPELTKTGDRVAAPACDVFSLGCVLWEVFTGSKALQGCDNLYGHRSACSRLQQLDPSQLPSLIRDAVSRSLAVHPQSRLDAAALRGCPLFHAPAVAALKELDALPSRDPSLAAAFLGNLTSMLDAQKADVEYRECFTDRTLLIVVLPSLDACVRAQPKLCAPAAPALLACAARLDARAFRKSIQPILERFLVDAAGPQAVLAVVEHATLLLDRADASWAAKRVVDALARALRDDAGPRLRDAALRQLASSDVLDAVIAKASIAARNGVSSRVSTDLVPAVCRCVASKTCALATRVTAHKALAAALDRPPATPPEVLMRVVLPALRDSVRLVHGQPALAMCVLGCFDLVAKRLPEQSRILRDVLPSLIPLLDEKALNARQFDMVAGRVEAMLASAIQARRGELDSPSSVQPRLSAPDPFRATPSPPAAAPAPVPRAPSPAADVYRGAGSSHASDYNFGAGAMPGDPLALTSASHARAPAVPIPKLPKPPAPAPRRRGPPARGPPKQQDAVWRPPGSSNGGVAKLTAQLAAEDPFAAGNDPFASSGGASPAFGGASSVDPFAAVGLSSGDPFAGMGGATNAPMPSMGGLPPPPGGADPFAGMSAAAPASSAFDFMNS